MTMTFSSRSTPSISESSCGTIVVSTSDGDARPAGAEQRLHLVEEHDDGVAVVGLLAGPLEDQPDVPLGLADVLVEQLGALDVEEVGLPRLAALLLGDLAGQRGRDRLGDQRLAAAGRAVEQHALRRLELVLVVEVGVQVGQLDGVADRPRSGRSAHRCPRSRCRGPPRGRGRRPRPWGSARRRSRSATRACSASPTRIGSPSRESATPADPLLVGVGHDEHPVVVEDLLDDDDLADALEAVGGDDVHRLVEHDLAAGHELARLDRRAHGDLHLAAAGEDVDGRVVVGLDDDAVGRRRLGEPVDLGLERDDLLARLPAGCAPAARSGSTASRARAAAAAGRVSSSRSCAGRACPRRRAARRPRRASDSRSAPSSAVSRVPGWLGRRRLVGCVMTSTVPHRSRSAVTSTLTRGHQCRRFRVTDRRTRGPASPTGRARRWPRASSRSLEAVGLRAPST